MEYNNEKDGLNSGSSDSTKSVPVDTSTLEGKRAYILDQFAADQGPVGPQYDTVVDMNYDGYDDYVIGFYYQSGTGIKNGAMVYIYDPHQNRYMQDTLLSYIANPTFYLKEKKITSFYLPYGFGTGRRLNFINGKWIETMLFSVDNKEDSSIWEIVYPLTKKKISIKKPYEMIPPKEILETNVNLEDAPYRAFQ